MPAKLERDVERAYSNAAFAAKLRRLADAVEKGKRNRQSESARIAVAIRRSTSARA